VGRIENGINGLGTKYDVEETGFSTNYINITHAL
jgi:hypothetical protein